MYETLLLEQDGAIATITLNRPKALNAVNSSLLSDLDRALTALETAGTQVIIVTGAGEKAFVAGADIAEMKGMRPEQARAFSAQGHRVLGRLSTISAATIAAVNGFALGGGLEVALCCDLIYASENARLGLPETGLALVPGFGGTQRLPRLVGPQLAREMIFTGDLLDAATAKARGLVIDVLPREKLLEHARKVAEKIASRGPLAVAAAKRLVRQGAALELDAANRLEQHAFGDLFATRDTQEGLAAYLEKRTPSYNGT